MIGAALIAVAGPAAVWGAFRVRRDDALVWHSLLYAVAGGLLAVGIAWVSGYGLVGAVFFLPGALLSLADAYFRIFEWFT